MPVFDQFRWREVHLEDEGITKEGFCERKGRPKESEINPIFTLLLKLNLALQHALGTPTQPQAFLFLIDSLRRVTQLSFLRTV